VTSPVQTCRSCGAFIQFRTNDQGRVMILDYAPNPEGRIIARSTGAVHVLTRAEQAGIPAEITRYMDHHVTCPNRDAWRGKTR